MSDAVARRVLLVEDEFLIALLVEDLLAQLGHVLAATAGRLDKALALARDGAFDIGLLDLTLGGVRSYPVADVLHARDIPFAFMTGHDGSDIGAVYAAVPVLQKPFRRENFAAMIERLLSRR